jgi:hypothetical protein
VARVNKGVAILVGTRKGAYIFRGDERRQRWEAEGPLFAGEPVYHMAFDPRDNCSVWAACNWTWGGPKIRRSGDLGRSWSVVSNPVFREPSPLTFKRAWHIEPGHPTQPDVTWVGVEPAALFRTMDRGEYWEPVAGLNEHPTRERWESGGGGLALHSIAIDAGDPKHMAVGISAGGAYESRDGGLTWRPWNEATRAEHLPDKEPEVGQCVHHLVAHPASPGVWFQRNHFGVYWRGSDDPRWVETTEGLPTDYGFAGAIHPHDPATAYVIPLDPNLRHAPEPGVAVYRTADRGRRWERLDRGLPKGATVEVMREGLATDRLDPAGLYFGAISGDLWASADEGASWSLVAEYLPPILSVSTATIR